MSKRNTVAVPVWSQILIQRTTWEPPTKQAGWFLGRCSWRSPPNPWPQSRCRAKPLTEAGDIRRSDTWKIDEKPQSSRCTWTAHHLLYSHCLHRRRRRQNPTSPKPPLLPPLPSSLSPPPNSPSLCRRQSEQRHGHNEHSRTAISLRRSPTQEHRGHRCRNMWLQFPSNLTF